MEIKAIKCPSCGADLQVPDDKDFMTCPYCQTTVQVREEIKSKYGGDPNNLIKLADEDLKTGNYQEAYDYYNKALESDASSPDAWLGKAISSGFMSNNINQMMEWVSVAVSNSTGEKQQSIKIKAASYINAIIIGYDGTLNKTSNLIPFLDLSTGSVEVYTSVINAMETAHNYSPNNTEILHNLIKVCIHSKKYIHTAEIDVKINKFKDELKQLDPNYDPNQDPIPSSPSATPPQSPQQPTSAYSGTTQTSQKAKGCVGKFLVISIILMVVLLGVLGIVIYYAVHSVNDTVNTTKENITKQIEPLKDLKKNITEIPQNSIVKEYTIDDIHVMNVYIENSDMNKIIKVNNYLISTYKDKYSELAINYFDDKNAASSYDEVIQNPFSYKITEESNSIQPGAIMIISKINRQSSLFQRAGLRYNKKVY